MQIKLAVAVIVCIALTAAVISVISQSDEIVVRRTPTGFVPQKVLVKKGDAVVFVNESSKEIQPASDFHPTHGIYPEFDPKKGIAPGVKWRFVFQKAGVWSYHDHLSPETVGTVIVVGGLPGESSKECLARLSSSGAQVATCYEGDIADALERGGLTSAFELFAKVYERDSVFPRNCHDVSHILGTAAYRQYVRDKTAVKRIETSYCGYGFYHGFMEAMLVDKGPGSYTTAREYCDSLRSGAALDAFSGACFHGIGHATFDSLDAVLWGDDRAMVRAALSICEKALQDEAERIQCSTGVFNSLGNAKGVNQYHLSKSDSTLLTLCREQKPEYQPGCYVQAGIGVIHNLNLTRAGVISLIKTYPQESQAPAMSGYVDLEVRNALPNISFQEFVSLCGTLSGNLQKACIQGVLSGLVQGGQPGVEYKRIFEFCDLIGKSERTSCYEYSFSPLRSLAPDVQQYQSVCRAITEPDVVARCLRRFTK